MDSEKWAQLRRHLLVGQDLAPSTVEKTMRALQVLERAGVVLDAPSLEQYEAYIERRKLAGARPTCLQNYARAFRRLLIWHRLEWRVRAPRPPEPDIELVSDDVVRALVVHDEDLQDDVAAVARISFLLAHFTPLRPPSELVGLKLQDFDRDASTLRAWSNKSRRRRWVRLEPWLRDKIVEYVDGARARLDRHNAPTLLVDERGLPWDKETFRRWLTRRGRRVHKGWHPYLARHWAITYRLRQTGYQLLAVARWVGHNDPRTTQRYVHVDDAELWRPVPPLETDGEGATG